MRVLALLLAFTCAAVTARAASFDCKAARSVTEKAICADPGLSQLDDALAQAYADLLVAVPRPVVQRDIQRDWISRTRDKAAPVRLRKVMEERIADLHATAADARAVRKPIAADTLATRCVDLRGYADETCKVDSSGRVADSPSGPFAWQLQSYHQGDLRTAAGVVVFAVQADGRLMPVLWDNADDAYFEEPGPVVTPGGTLLDLSGSLDGTGNINIESLYQFADGGWHEIDATSWLSAMSARLPKGLAAWKGIYPDWVHMTAETDLWRSSDANCCPTGGSAQMTLMLRNGRVELTGLTVSREPRP